MRSVVTLLALALMVQLGVEAVDKHKFKTCSQSAFCRRNRAYAQKVKAAQSPVRYVLNAATVQINGNVITADLQDNEWPLRPALGVQISLLANDVTRVLINEKFPLHRRFQVRDVLQEPGLKAQAFSNVETKDGFIIATITPTKALRIRNAPFGVELLVDGKVAVQANAQGLLNFEPYREKNPAPAPPPVAEGEAAPAAPALDEARPRGPSIPDNVDVRQAKYPYDEDGMWEESFGGHTDSKPRGPSDVSMDVAFVGAEQIYGIPEHASSLALKTTTGTGSAYTDPYRLYNLDVFEYDLDVPMALYGAIPFIMAHDEEKTTAMLWLNAAETYIDVDEDKDKKYTHWISESGVIDLFLFSGPTPKDIFFQYATLTGFTALPQKFAIASHQCRWNYKSEQDVAEVDAGFDEHDIPYDVLWLDIEHTDGKKYFTWDSHNFPTPAKMQENLAAKGRKMVTIVDPHIKRDGGYRVHTEATRLNYYIRNAQSKGGDYEGWCWPGSVSYLDFLRPEVRSYFSDQFQLDSYKGSTLSLFTWNDMNEPSVFNGPEVTMPKDNLHGDHEMIEHRDVHNMYGFYQHWSSGQGLTKRDGNRPFVLTRSFFSGSQRWGAVWTGDNKAEWSHLAAAQPMLLSLNIAGFSFAGADVGGFFGNPDVELLVRWYQAGVWHPFLRAHAHIDTKRREPWLFGEPHTTHIRNAVRTRYAFLPYLYTTFHIASTTGMPVMRPLWVEFPRDGEVYAMDDQFMVGDAILVKPVTQAQTKSIPVYLPGADTWYDIVTLTSYAGGQLGTMETPAERIPVFQRGGTIIPKQERARRSSAVMVNDPYTLVVALDTKERAEGTLYVDDGQSYAYQNGGYIHRTFSFADGVLKSVATPHTAPNSGLFKTDCVVERVVILGLGSKRVSRATLKTATGTEELIVHQSFDPHRVIIRRPFARIDSDFTITLA